MMRILLLLVTNKFELELVVYSFAGLVVHSLSMQLHCTVIINI